MKLYFIITFLTMLSYIATCQKSMIDDKMRVEWEYNDTLITFQITTPSEGWQAIGFNENSGLKDTHLIMSRVLNDGTAEVVEYYVESPGNYKPMNLYGIQQRVRIISAIENKGSTFVKYSFPIKASSQMQKNLNRGMEYTMHYAYSMDDDFQHHSIFRSKRKIIL